MLTRGRGRTQGEATWKTEAGTGQRLSQARVRQRPPGSAPEPPREHGPADTWILDLWPPKGERVKFCCFGPPATGCWQLTPAATGTYHRAVCPRQQARVAKETTAKPTHVPQGHLGAYSISFPCRLSPKKEGGKDTFQKFKIHTHLKNQRTEKRHETPLSGFPQLPHTCSPAPRTLRGVSPNPTVPATSPSEPRPQTSYRRHLLESSFPAELVPDLSPAPEPQRAAERPPASCPWPHNPSASGRQ